MYPKYKFRKLFHALLLSTIVCVLYLQILKSTQNSSAAMSNNYAAEEEILKGSLQQKIVIGLVVCGITDEAVTLLKSVLISAKASHVEEIEFHIITEDWLVTAALKQKMHEFENIMKPFIQKISANFHSVYKLVATGYEKEFIGNRASSCTYARIFLPDYFFSELSQILYLDTDVIVTGNIQQIWNSFMERVVSSKDTPKLAALVQNSEGNTHLQIYQDHFAHIAHVKPRGVNAGVMFMNLVEMRRANWTAEIMKIYFKQGRKLDDQSLINIYFSENIGQLVQFPCQYNFQHLHCDMGLACNNVTADPGGIRLMHGAGETFADPKSSHSQLFRQYKLFNLSEHEHVNQLLFQPLRHFYSQSNYAMNNSPTNCLGSIGLLLCITTCNVLAEGKAVCKIDPSSPRDVKRIDASYQLMIEEWCCHNWCDRHYENPWCCHSKQYLVLKGLTISAVTLLVTFTCGCIYLYVGI